MNEVNKREVTLAHHEKFIWTRFGTIFLGLWLLTSPGTFGYLHQGANYSDWISGFLLVFFGVVSMKFPLRSWIWGSCFVGIWLQFAPLIFWAKNPVIYVNDTLIGVLAIAFCILVPMRPKQLETGPSIPPGWSYNPSSWTQRIPIIFFGTFGWFVARYLTSYQLGYIDHLWEPFGTDTVKVITSMIAKDFPVPDAGLGALAYSLEAIMGAKGGARRWHTMPWMVVAFGVLVVPLGFVSILLVMLQPVVVGAWCGLCLIMAACMLVMLSLAVDEVIAVLQYLKHSKQQGRSVWNTFWKGSNYTHSEPDHRTPSFHSNPWKIIQSMFWGVNVPWNLFLTALIGCWALFFNDMVGFSGALAKNMDVCGALMVTFSVIAWSETTRSIRFINIIPALWLAISAFIFPHDHGFLVWHNVILALIVILISFYRGKIKEKYGTWNKVIF